MPANDPVRSTIGVGAFIRSPAPFCSGENADRSTTFSCKSLFWTIGGRFGGHCRRKLTEKWYSAVFRSSVRADSTHLVKGRSHHGIGFIHTLCEQNVAVMSSWQQDPVQNHHQLYSTSTWYTCHGGEGFPLSTSRSTITLPTMPKSLQHLPAHLRTPIGSTATFQPNRGGKDNLDAVKKNLTMCTPCESEFILNSAGSMLTPRLTFS